MFVGVADRVPLKNGSDLDYSNKFGLLDYTISTQSCSQFSENTSPILDFFVHFPDTQVTFFGRSERPSTTPIEIIVNLPELVSGFVIDLDNDALNNQDYCTVSNI